MSQKRPNPMPVSCLCLCPPYPHQRGDSSSLLPVHGWCRCTRSCTATCQKGFTVHTQRISSHCCGSSRPLLWILQLMQTTLTSFCMIRSAAQARAVWQPPDSPLGPFVTLLKLLSFWRKCIRGFFILFIFFLSTGTLELKIQKWK